MCKNKIVLFIVFISILTVFTKGSFASNNQEEIKNLIETVIDSCALHPNGGFSFHKYLTDNYLIGESELQSVTYHIINYFWIDGIKADSVDRRIVTVKCSRAAILTFYNNLNIRNDTIKIVLSLKKINKKNWKIDDIVNYKEFYLFGDDAVAYISVLLDDLKPTYYPPGEIDPSPLTKLYTPLMKYFHNNYVFTKEYLEKLSSRELRILRNKIFALYGRKFKTAWLQEYFNKQDWYELNPDYSDDLLTDNDKANIKLILEVEKEKQQEEESIEEDDK